LVVTVYLENITEIEKLPSAGVLAYLQMHTEDRFSHISTSLPGMPEEFCRSYGWGEVEGDQDNGEGVKLGPFVSIEE
jgi:hypothetical protein